MDHGGEAARPTMVGFADLGTAGAVQGGEAHMSTGTFHGQLGAAAARRAGFDEFARRVHAAVRHAEVPVAVLHHEPGPGVAYANIVASWRQPGPVDVVLVGPQRPGGVMPVHDNYYGYSALQPHPGAGLGVVLADLLPGSGGAVYNGDYALQPRPGAGHGEVLVILLPDGPGHGEAFVGQLPGGGGAAYHDYVYYALQPRSIAGHGEVLIDLLPDDAGHGEVFIGLLPGCGVALHDNYGYYPWQPRPRVGSDEVFIGPLPDGVGVVFVNSGNFAHQTLPAPGTRGIDGIAGALRGPNLGAVYDNRGVVGEHLRRLLPFAGIGASFVAVDGLAAGPGSPAVAFHLSVLLLGGLLLLILHVLRV